jgi:hypothetical protein
MFWRRPALRAGRRLSIGPPPAFGGRRPHKIPPTRIQKLFASKLGNLVLHPPTPYTLSPLLKGGEGRGEGGSYTRMPCPFGTLLVTLYHFKSKAFLM